MRFDPHDDWKRHDITGEELVSDIILIIVLGTTIGIGLWALGIASGAEFNQYVKDNGCHQVITTIPGKREFVCANGEVIHD